MAVNVGTLTIEMAANIARLQRDMQKAQSTVTGHVRKINSLLNTLGVGISIAGVVAFTKSIVDTALAQERLNNTLKASLGTQQAVNKELQFLRKTSDELGLQFQTTARQYSKLTAASQGTTLAGKDTREIFLSIAKASAVLGLSADETGGALKAIEQIISKGTVSAEELRGQLGERLPGAFKSAARAIGVTTAELDKMLRAGELTAEELLPALAKELDKTYGPASQQAAQGLNAQINRLDNSFMDLKVAIGDVGLVELVSAGTKALTGLLSVVAKVVNGFKALGLAIADIPILGGFAKATVGGGLFDLLTSQAHAQTIANEATKEAIKLGEELANIPVPSIKPIQEKTKAIKEQVSESQKLIQSLKDELNETGKTANEIKRLQAAKLGILDAAGPLIDAIERENELYEQQQQDLQFLSQITEKYRTEEEKVNDEIEKLNRLLQSGKLDWNTYQAAVSDVKSEFQTVPQTVEKVGEELDQFSIQAARNMQSAFGEIFFDAFEGRVGGILDTFTSAIKRMVAEAAAADLLSLLFNTGKSGNLTSLATAFTPMGGLINGLSSLMGGGLPATGATNVYANGFIGGIGTAIGGKAGAGSFFSAGNLLGVTAATFLADGLIRGFTKDLKINNKFISSIPVLGALAGGLFGRGPLKQQDSLIRGNVTEQGIAGNFLTATNFSAKGGLLRGNKVDRVIINANTGELVAGAPGLPESGISGKLMPFAEEAAKQAVIIGKIFDDAIKGFNLSMRESADVLGLGTRSLDNFQRWIQLTATSAEGITEQQIAEEIQNIGDHMANVLLPGLQNMRKEGETATQALNRIVGEFLSLENALVVFGVSVSEAEAAISALSVAARTDLVEAAGGAEALNQQIGFFADNFLTAEEQLEIAFNALDVEMHKLGFSANMSVERFKQLIISVTQVGGVSVETAAGLLKLAPMFLRVKEAQAELAAEAARAAAAVDGLSASASGASASVNSLSGSVSGLGTAAEIAAARTQQTLNTLEAMAASEQRIINARQASIDAQNNLNLLLAQERAADAQQDLTAATREQSEAQRELSQAQSILSSAQSALVSAQNAAIQKVVEDRNKLINSYQEEAQILDTIADRFGNVIDRLLDFKESLALGNLSPFTPAQQLGIAQDQFEAIRARALSGDIDALERLPEVARAFLEASQTANASSDAFVADFNRVQSTLAQAQMIAREERDIAQEQFEEIQATVVHLQKLNEQTQQGNRNILSVEEATRDVQAALGLVNAATSRVENANNLVESATAEVEAATSQVNDSVRAVEGGTTAIERATRDVERTLIELGNAILQGFGNLAISDQQIRDFLAANPGLSDQQIVDAAIQYGVSGTQLARATGVSIEEVNRRSGGRTVSGSQISDFVNANINDPMAIYNAAIANGISSQRLADESVLTKQQIDAFVRQNNLQPFHQGTDFMPRTGFAFVERGEAVTPANSMNNLVEEFRRMREEWVIWRGEQTEQARAVIRTISRASHDNAEMISKSNKETAQFPDWKLRLEPVTR